MCSEIERATRGRTTTPRGLTEPNSGEFTDNSIDIIIFMSGRTVMAGVEGISVFLPYERNTEQVRMQAPVGSGGLG